MFVMICAIVALLLLYLSFMCFGLLVQTRSRPYGLLHRPYTLAHIYILTSSPFCLRLGDHALAPCVLTSYVYMQRQRQETSRQAMEGKDAKGM